MNLPNNFVKVLSIKIETESEDHSDDYIDEDNLKQALTFSQTALITSNHKTVELETLLSRRKYEISILKKKFNRNYLNKNCGSLTSKI